MQESGKLQAGCNLAKFGEPDAFGHIKHTSDALVSGASVSTFPT